MRALGPVTRFAGLLTAPLLAAGLLAGLSPATASAAPACKPGTVTQPLSPGDVANQLNAVSVLSPCSVWVAGSSASTGQGSHTLIEHWNGRAWTVVPSPHPGASSELNGIRAFSATSIWAVGETESGKSTGRQSSTLILHYNGHAWTRVASPSPGKRDNELMAVRWVSATEAWAVGDAQTGSRRKSLILRWKNRRWRQVASPSPAFDTQVRAVAVNSARDAWAVGAISNGVSGPILGPGAVPHAGDIQQGFILHWNGTAWRPVTEPRVSADVGLFGVGATGSANVWAVGLTVGKSGVTQTLTLRWRGRRWTHVASPANQPQHASLLDGVAAISAGNAWAAGTDSEITGGQQALVLHWTGSRWLPVATAGGAPGDSVQLLGVAAGSASNVWAVGELFPAGGGSRAFAFHAADGARG